MTVAFHLETAPDDAPSFRDTSRRRWRLLTPSRVGEKLAERASNGYVPGCEHLCHWYHDDPAENARYVINDIFCHHRQPSYIPKPPVVHLDGYVVPADPGWTTQLVACAVTLLGEEWRKPVVQVGADEWVNILAAFGYDVDGMKPLDEEAKATLDVGYRLFDLFRTIDTHRQHTATLVRPANSGTWRDRQQQINAEQARLREEGWTERVLTDCEKIFQSLKPPANHYAGRWNWTPELRTEAAWQIGQTALRRRKRGKDDEAEKLEELLGWDPPVLA